MRKTSRIKDFISGAVVVMLSTVLIIGVMNLISDEKPPESIFSVMTSSISQVAKENDKMLYEKGINHDIPQAFYGLGNMYYYGAGVEKDLEQAKILYMKAAARGEMLSQFKLGVMYEKGEGVEINLEQAMIYYTMSATHGNGYAQKKLSDMYKEGKGVEIDMEKAKLFEQSSNRNIDQSVIYALNIKDIVGYKLYMIGENL